MEQAKPRLRFGFIGAFGVSVQHTQPVKVGWCLSQVLGGMRLFVVVLQFRTFRRKATCCLLIKELFAKGLPLLLITQPNLGLKLVPSLSFCY